jgi:1,4-dihydroxy-2-naphthoate octaprenyltransferase
MGCLIAAILVVNNLRDIKTDRAAGKRTLAVRIGDAATRREYESLLLVAYLIPPVMWLTSLASPWLLLSWVTVPMAVKLVRSVKNSAGRALNLVLAGTARLCLFYAVAFSIGIML